jgi:putative selenium metabolism hydrolase
MESILKNFIMLNQTQHEQVVECCRDLVQAQSLAGRERAAADVVERWMRQLGYDDVHVDEYGSVVGRIIGTAGNGPHLHFDGHIDTVPATAHEQWQHAPYGAELVDGKIYGRGATDMKGPVAAMLCAAAFVPREQVRGVLTVSASVAEEELEGAALNAILQQNRADMVIIGESTLLQAGIAQKGRAGIRVTTYGRPAHSSTPHLGDNAIYRMVDVIARLRALKPPEDRLLGSGVIELVEIVSAPYPGTSIVPDQCMVRWDRRLIRGETRESVLAEVRTALIGLDRIDVSYLDVTVSCYTGATLRGEDFHPAWEIPETSPLVEAALQSLAGVGKPARTCPIAYCTNGSGSAGVLGIPSLIIGPGDPALFHTIDEYISVEQLVEGTAVYMGMIQALTSRV